jgi:flagellar protein FlaG
MVTEGLWLLLQFPESLYVRHGSHRAALAPKTYKLIYLSIRYYIIVKSLLEGFYMRIIGTDAASATQVKDRDVSISTKENTVHKTVNILDNKSISRLTDSDKRGLSISEKVVVDAIERANRAISGANRKFEISVHEKTKEIMVKVIDSETNKVIREIPSEKILDLVAKLWELAGIIVDERR